MDNEILARLAEMQQWIDTILTMLVDVEEKLSKLTGDPQEIVF